MAGFGPLGDEDLARLGVTLRGMGERTWREREENKVPCCCLEKTAHDAMRHGALEEAVAVVRSRAGTRHQLDVTKERAERSQSGGRSPA